MRLLIRLDKIILNTKLWRIKGKIITAFLWWYHCIFLERVIKITAKFSLFALILHVASQICTGDGIWVVDSAPDFRSRGIFDNRRPNTRLNLFLSVLWGPRTVFSGVDLNLMPLPWERAAVWQTETNDVPCRANTLTSKQKKNLTRKCRSGLEVARTTTCFPILMPTFSFLLQNVHYFL